MVGLQAIVPTFGESWRKFRGLDLDSMVAALADGVFRRQLIDEAEDSDRRWPDPAWLFSLGNEPVPDHSMGDHNNLLKMADAANEHWVETFLRLSLDTQGKILFNEIGENQNLKALRDLFEGDRVLPGVGDAGAHVTMVMDAGWSTFVLAHWVRSEGLYSIQEGVRRMTSAPARILGVSDRGLLKEGMRADINVFDASNVNEGYPYRVHDFPGGAPRLTQRSVGYKATLVNGQINVLDGEYTGNRAGMVL